jgi:NTE family protein
VLLGVQATGPLNDDASIAGTTLGGFLRLSGLRENELLGSASFLGRLIYYRQLGGESLFGQPVYTGLSLEAGNAWLDEDDASLGDLLPNGSLFLGVDTLLGPVYLSVGFAEHGRRQYSLVFGRLFGHDLNDFFD